MNEEIDGQLLPVVRRQRDTFVPPAPPAPVRHELAPVQPHELVAAPNIIHQVTMTTTHQDRARGFLLASLPVSGLVGLMAVIAAVTLFGQPLTLAVVLTWFFTVGVGVLGLTFGVYLVTSPDGQAIIHQVLGFRLLRKEQDFRHDYLRYQAGIPDKAERKHRRKMARKQLAQKGRH